MFRRDRFKVSLPANLAARGDDVAAFEWREEITRALGRLRPIYREAFLLRYVENLEYAEMARRSGTGESTLRMRVKRANDRLRELLAEVRIA
jgi:RNA polymerase sigma-70 factor (ECF subfamily)